MPTTVLEIKPDLLLPLLLTTPFNNIPFYVDIPASLTQTEQIEVKIFFQIEVNHYRPALIKSSSNKTLATYQVNKLFEKLNQTRSILLQFTQDLHLLIAYHQTKTLISRFFPSYAANLEKRQFSFRSPKSAILPSTTCTCDDHFHTG